ncbi:MAG TPA: PilZ domain-containing protein [Candidatus Acidoferrum sp.]|nr:PilZ domain-containing protein [Candidatus Acidoferrum sp.]
MSEHLSAVAPTQFAAVPATRAERRQMRRAGISLQVRIRSADFNDGNLDEVRMTQNASRKALYFFTNLNRYYKGMRVRVTSPYNPDAGATNLEQIGEVVRVQRREDEYGVAVAILAGAQPGGTPSAGPSALAESASAAVASTAPSERRCGARSPFIAPVEMLEMQTGSRIQARTSDLSPQGCYIDTLNPLPVATAVRLQIHRAGMILDVLANVSSRHVGSGMGLVFGEITATQRAVLESWLGELGLPPRSVFENPFPQANEASSPDADRALRLVQILLRKGVLSQSEATEVLREF